MAGKFYITNGCEFLGTDLKTVSSMKQAKRFSHDDGMSMLQKQLKVSPNWRLQRVFPTGKKYVITTATKFVGGSAPVVNDYAAAKVFKSAADASAYIRNTSTLVKQITNPVIINDAFDVVGIPPRKFTDEQLEVLGVNKKVSPSPRHIIKKSVLTAAYTESSGLCALCGKPMTQWDKSVDHIIPKSKGGKDNKANIRYVHKACNQMKGNMMDKDMYQVISNVEAKHVYEQPKSPEAMKLIRAYLRGLITEYKEAGLFQQNNMKGSDADWASTV